MESQNIEELSLQDDLREPFSAALTFFADLGVNLQRVLWVMPRVESLGRFKALWVERMGASVCVAPRIQTADRLSQTVSQGTWLGLQDQLVGVLKGLPHLCGGLSTEQLWGLAQEYLELAMRLVIVGRNHPTLWQRYMDTSAFAAQEVQVVLQVAQTFEAELLQCLPLPDVSMSELDLIVWFDDAELMPSLWFQHFFPELPVRRVVLPRVEGSGVWERLASRLMGRVRLSLAPDETAQARQAADQVLRWLREDANKEVVIAVLDRLAARRLVSQLAELGVLVDDRTGWRLSTSNVAGWFDALLCQHVEHGQVLALGNPFTGQAVAGFQPWARTGVYGLSEWANAYEGLLTTYGMDAMLHADEAGRLLLTGLRALGRLQSRGEWSAAGFLAAWRHWAEGERFRPLDIESPVRLVPLLSTRLCRFERVLVLGCAQSHLQESPPGLLPPAVAQALGFPGPKVARIQKLSALYELLSLTPDVCVVHAERADGQSQVLLPELLWLDILLKKAQAESWLAKPHDDCVPVEPKPVEPLKLVAAPDGASIPAELRVTALDDWVACPLRFGLKHALPWPLERARTEGSFEQLRGIFVHQVFERVALHMSAPKANRGDLSIWQQVLWEQGQAVFRRLGVQQRAVLHPFMAQFEGLVPRIAGRLMHRHIEGLWQVDRAEKQVRGTVALSQCGRAIQLSGRLDRLERQGERWAISDIKFKRPAELKKQAADPLSVPQLPMYQYLIAKETGVRCEDLSFLAVSKEGVEWIDFEPLPEAETQKGFASWGDVLFDQLSQALDAFFSAGQVWLAHPGEACVWCDVQHVCRPEAMVAVLDEENVQAE